MGNKLCKKKNEIDGNHPKSTPFVRIMSRFHLKPRWKSDSHLERKHVNRYDVPSLNGTLPQDPQQRPLSISKSSDWTEVSLEVPDDDKFEMKNSKLVFSTDSTDGTPLPPPRKHKKGFKEKIESVAKSGLQAFQNKKPVEEPLCVKKIIDYSCPTDEEHEKTHNRDHKLLPRIATPKINHKITARDREAKRKKNLSVVSLPNYTDLKFSLAGNGENIDQNDGELRKSVHSLPGETKKLTTFIEKKDYITRCRSFGSSLPQLLLHKLTNNKAPLAEIESDDSFGGLEDWDLKIIEHYNPKDSSLPRNSKPVRSEAEILNDLESLIVADEDVQEDLKPKTKPKPPVRRSESLVKKINKTAVEVARKVTNSGGNKDGFSKNAKNLNTPPPSPDEKVIEETVCNKISFENLPVKDEQGNVEHSSLLKILQDFSIKDAQEKYQEKHQEKHQEKYQEKQEGKHQLKHKENYQEKHQEKLQENYQEKHQLKHQDKLQDKHQLKHQEKHQEKHQLKHQENHQINRQDQIEKVKNNNVQINENETIKNIKNQGFNMNNNNQAVQAIQGQDIYDKKYHSFEINNFLNAERNNLIRENNNRMKAVDIQT